QAFFRYLADSRSPGRIRPHGEGPASGRVLREYHEERGSVRTWASRAEIGADIRRGDIITIDFDFDGVADHICIAASYTPPSGASPGQLVTIDGNIMKDAGDDLTTSNVVRRSYAQTSGDGEVPAFAPPDATSKQPTMRLLGRGRPSAVDFETDHFYPGFTGAAAHDPDGTGGPLQSQGIQRAERGPVATTDPEAAFDAAAAGSPGQVPYRD